MAIEEGEKISRQKRERDGGRVESKRQIQSQLYKKFTKQTAGANTRIYHHNRLEGL